jgi:DNA-binding HxlR family transcriptional regulator
MDTCPNSANNQLFDETLKIMGDVWTLRILVLLNDQDCRFCQLERGIEGINPVTLTNRLKRLEEARFLAREEDPTNKQAVTYSLTKKGKGIMPVLREMKTFSQKYLRSK